MCYEEASGKWPAKATRHSKNNSLLLPAEQAGQEWLSRRQTSDCVSGILYNSKISELVTESPCAEAIHCYQKQLSANLSQTNTTSQASHVVTRPGAMTNYLRAGPSRPCLQARLKSLNSGLKFGSVKAHDTEATDIRQPSRYQSSRSITQG
jgi:hypothetical protein